MSLIDRDREVSRIASSGWSTLKAVPSSVGETLNGFLRSRDDAWWAEANSLASGLRKWLDGKRFCEQIELGLLFVPSPETLDVRLPMSPELRKEQRLDLLEDVVDPRLSDGVDLVPDGAEGRLFLTCVGEYGISMGSYEDIRGADEADFTVTGHDVRVPMTRQVWGARVLQAGSGTLPDTEANASWTFTLFPGDELVDGMAASGAILKSHVRFRLGKADRGIGSARVAPAIPLDIIS